MFSLVFVDLDNTIFNTNKQLEVLGIDTNIYPAQISEVNVDWSAIFQQAEVIEPVKSFIHREYNDSLIVYLTARQEKWASLTLSRFEKLDLPSGDMVFTNGKPKGIYARKYHLAFLKESYYSGNVTLVEDSPHEIQSVLYHLPDTKLVVPDWIYNRHIVGERTTRIHFGKED